MQGYSSALVREGHPETAAILAPGGTVLMPITDFELMEAPEIKKAFKKVGAVLGRSSIITSPDALEELQGAVTQLVRTAYEFGEDSSVAAFAAALDVPLPKGLS